MVASAAAGASDFDVVEGVLFWARAENAREILNEKIRALISPQCRMTGLEDISRGERGADKR
jgi:hypothetical protein